jgi:hypothetical protein
MFTKLMLLVAMSFLLMGMSNCSSVKYGPPQFEDCGILTTWSEEKQTDVGTCYCIDDSVNSKKSFDELVTYVSSVMKEHPLQEASISYLQKNQESIIKNHDYELPISYCRGHSSIGPKARTALTKWAEDNRLERIRCELGEN